MLIIAVWLLFFHSFFLACSLIHAVVHVIDLIDIQAFLQINCVNIYLQLKETPLKHELRINILNCLMNWPVNHSII
jgi:hypothetical protein